jgi:Cdc6-like AAA superfamily ATPase
MSLNKRSLHKLFRYQPPKEQNDIIELFCNREKELKWGLDFLNPDEAFDKILAVHGRTGCGKSHLVERLLLRIEECNMDYVIIKVNANNQAKPRKILQDILLLISDKCKGFLAEVDQDNLNILRLLATDELHEWATGDLEKKETIRGADLKIGQLLLNAALSSKSGTQSSYERKYTIKSPSNNTLVRWINYTASILSKSTNKRILIFVDDLDLLDLYGKEGKDVSYQLLTYLKPIAASEATTVIVTMRPPYFRGGEKEFTNFIDVRLLESNTIKEIYQRRVNLFNDGQQIFSDKALSWIECGAFGRVGSFLRRCGEIYQYFYDLNKTITFDDLKTFVQQDIYEKENDSTTSNLMAEIKESIHKGCLEIAVTQNLDDSQMLYNILSPIAGRMSHYSINPLYVEVIRELKENYNLRR